MSGQVDEDVRRERLARLQGVVEPRRHAFNAACLGRKLPVLFERVGRHPGQIVGKSPYLQPVQVQADAALIGEVCDVMITSLGSNSLFGRTDPDSSAPTAASKDPA